MTLNTRKILIIGATSGIGRMLAQDYLLQGARVAVTGRREQCLSELKKQHPERVYTYVNDVQTAQAPALLHQAAADMGGLDTVVICAGMGDINLELTSEIELDTVRTNVLGFTDFADAAFTYFKAHGGGRLAGISSIAAFRGSDTAPAYFASKAYVSNYLQGLRKKAIKEKLGISVTTIIPGFVDTALAKGVGGKGLFWVAPLDKAVRQIFTAIEKKKKRAFITKRWFWIYLLLKIVPDFIYNKV